MLKASTCSGQDRVRRVRLGSSEASKSLKRQRARYDAISDARGGARCVTEKCWGTVARGNVCVCVCAGEKGGRETHAVVVGGGDGEAVLVAPGQLAVGP